MSGAVRCVEGVTGRAGGRVVAVPDEGLQAAAYS